MKGEFVVRESCNERSHRPIEKGSCHGRKSRLEKNSLCQAEKVAMREKIILFGMVRNTYSSCNTDPFLV